MPQRMAGYMGAVGSCSECRASLQWGMGPYREGSVSTGLQGPFGVLAGHGSWASPAGSIANVRYAANWKPRATGGFWPVAPKVERQLSAALSSRHRRGERPFNADKLTLAARRSVNWLSIPLESRITLRVRPELWRWVRSGSRSLHRVDNDPRPEVTR